MASRIRHRHRPRHHELRARVTSTRTPATQAPVTVQAVAQLVNPGEVAAPTAAAVVPVSAGAAATSRAASLALPWDDARRTPSSASWRASAAPRSDRASSRRRNRGSRHPGVDRAAPILPWQRARGCAAGLAGGRVGARTWRHLRARVGARAQAPMRRSLATQEVLVTVPASFDAAARELTLRAAAEAGLADVTLLEEPQAAFYAWLAAPGRRLARAACRSATSCWSATSVAARPTSPSSPSASDDGELVLERVAVGDHILLGGDNMDLALARTASQQQLDAAGHRSSTRGSCSALWHACRERQGALLGEPMRRSAQPVTLLGRGTRLVGGSIAHRADARRGAARARRRLLPAVAPPRRGRSGRAAVGLQELGLPYAADAGHHAPPRRASSAAGGRQRRAGRRAASRPERAGRPDARAVQRRRHEGDAAAPAGAGCARRVARRRRAAAARRGGVLEAPDLDLAVARGAAYYGLARRGRGVRIRGGTARAYYIGIESAMPAVPGLEAAAQGALRRAVRHGGRDRRRDCSAREFGLVVGEPAEFRFLSLRRPGSRTPSAPSSRTGTRRSRSFTRSR